MCYDVFKDDFTIKNVDPESATGKVISQAKSYLDAASRRTDQKEALDRLSQLLWTTHGQVKSDEKFEFFWFILIV